jgi:3-hydroxy-9,10-secoandrosta-1,3,5(10)-triene-9,17-dione monooxygenase reductase component
MRSTAEFDTRLFRDVLGHFSTGVAVVTASSPTGPVGMTVQSVVALSLDPPLVLFCPAKSSTSWPAIQAAGHFAVNILAEDQRDLASRFARSGGDKYVDVDWEGGVTTAPILGGSLAHCECTFEAIYGGGDHDIAIGRVVDLKVRRNARPLLFYRGTFGSLASSE